MSGSGDPGVLPTSPTQDGVTPTKSDELSIVGGAGVEGAPPSAPPAVNADGVSDQTAQAAEALTWDKVSLPEGVEIAEDVQTEFLSLLNGELPREDLASKMLSLHARMMESAATEMVEEWENTQAEWREQVAAMPEFRGVPREQPLAEIARIVNRYGGPDARKAFDLTGAGNHPAIIRMLLKIAKDINEEAPVSGEPVVRTQLSREERIYGNKGE